MEILCGILNLVHVHGFKNLFVWCSRDGSSDHNLRKKAAGLYVAWVVRRKGWVVPLCLSVYLSNGRFQRWLVMLLQAATGIWRLCATEVSNLHSARVPSGLHLEVYAACY